MAENQNPQQSLRVLHIMSGFGGGISSFIYNKALEMPKHHIVFDVVTYDECDNRFTQAIEQTGGRIFTMLNPKKEGWKAFKYSFLKPLNTYQYDVIHCHIHGYRAMVYYQLVKLYQTEHMYIHAHLSGPQQANRFQRVKTLVDQAISRRITDQPIGCGRLAIQGVFGDNTAESDMMVIPNSVSLQRFDYKDRDVQALRKSFRQKFNISDETFLIAQPSRYEPVKNHQKTIQIARYIAEKQLSMHIICMGAGNLKESLVQQVIDQNLCTYITVADYQSKIEDVFPAFDSILLPSFSEGLPTVVVEAQAAGVPTVMSDTITQEVDLGLGMVEALPLTASAEEWIYALQKNGQNKQYPTQSQRFERLHQHNFSNESAGQLYADFLRGKINHYLIS